MTRRLLSASMVIAASLLSTSAVFASPVHINLPVEAKMGSKSTVVTVSVRNDSKTPMTITAGAAQMTIAPGQTTTAKLNVGDKIVAGEGSTINPAGTVLAVVAPELKGATIVLQ